MNWSEFPSRLQVFRQYSFQFCEIQSEVFGSTTWRPRLQNEGQQWGAKATNNKQLPRDMLWLKTLPCLSNIKQENDEWEKRKDLISVFNKAQGNASSSSGIFAFFIFFKFFSKLHNWKQYFFLPCQISNAAKEIYQDLCPTVVHRTVFLATVPWGLTPSHFKLFSIQIWKLLTLWMTHWPSVLPIFAPYVYVESHV